MDNYREDFIARIKKIPISIPLFTTSVKGKLANGFIK